MDRAVYQAIGNVSTPRLDKAMVRMSNAADRSRLWLGCATIMAALGTSNSSYRDHKRLGPDHLDTLATRHNLAYWRGEADGV